jgi:hypothetical protein
MVSTTNHWIKSDNDNETKNLTPLMNDSADISTEFQPVWISLSLISSKSSFFLYFTNRLLSKNKLDIIQIGR